MKLAAIALAALVLLAGCGGGADTPTADDLVPDPATAWLDKGPVILDGCRSGGPYTEAWACVYGDPASDRTAVLWGDSHAMQYAPPLIRLAETRGWRLVTMFRGDCLVAEIEFQPACDAWRQAAIRRIGKERPGLILMATDTGDGYALGKGAGPDRAASEPILRDAFAATLRHMRRLTRDGSGEVVVLRDLPRSKRRPPDCLLEHPEALTECDFEPFRKNPPGFDLVAARGVDGVKLIDLEDVVCRGGLCPASRDGMVVYRDTAHLSATYAVTLAGLLGRRIGDFPATGP
ncbi:MAG: hypothetical protein J0H98_00550 [Solirubrobacterales bacterium]|nr:hypothetical protein [Solirubrobacterales bacterium]